MSSHQDYRPENTVYIGNLNEKVTERLIYELFVQAGPIEVVTLPKSKEGQVRCFGFVEFKENVSVPYACELMHGIELFHSPLVVRPQNTERHSKPTNERNTSRSAYTNPRNNPSHNGNSNNPRIMPNQRAHYGGFSNAPSQPNYPSGNGVYVDRRYPPPPPPSYMDYNERNRSNPPPFYDYPQRGYNDRKRKYYND